MKKTLGFLAAFLFVALLSVSANKLDVKVVKEKSEAKLVLEDYENNWNKRKTFTDRASLNQILSERGVEGSFNIEKSFIYEKDDVNIMVMVSVEGALYEFTLTSCSGGIPARCGCSCNGCNGFAPYDLNGDGDCLDKWECTMACQDPW
jgi:hypothetical protein